MLQQQQDVGVLFDKESLSSNLTNFSLQSKIKRRRRSKSSKSEDEGFESPTSPLGNGSGVVCSPPGGQSNGHVIYDTSGEAINVNAPLAYQEDLEENEKHSLEITKEQIVTKQQQISPILSVSFV